MTYHPAAGHGPSGTKRVRVNHTALLASTMKLLQAIGEDELRDGLQDTPKRVAKAWAEITAGYDEDPATHLDKQFDADGAEGIVVVKNIPFYSLCEHHLLPFHGQAHIAYLPGRRITGLSKIARCVRGYAQRLQVQERLTKQVADAMQERLGTKGVAVVVEAEHLCMTMRGVRAPGSVTRTSELRGVFKDVPEARAEVMELLL